MVSNSFGGEEFISMTHIGGSQLFIRNGLLRSHSTFNEERLIDPYKMFNPEFVIAATRLTVFNFLVRYRLFFVSLYRGNKHFTRATASNCFIKSC